MRQDRVVPEGIDRFVSSATFRRPSLTSPLSAWNEHVPFAGWIIEALAPNVFVELGVHSGVSYFAFCEAVLQFELGTRCYAVDHWKGDVHSGEYGEEIFASVSRLNQDRYSAFSHLVRKDFDEAASDFEDGSIDLLHIDGLHTFEAVRHDFDTWLPKLSDQGVVLMHDTAEHKKDFGVFRLIDELRRHYPVFEFGHGHGLGVVGVGKSVPPAVAALTRLDAQDKHAAQMVRDLYQRLGSELALKIETDGHRKSAREQARAAESLERERTDLSRENEQLKASLVSLQQQVKTGHEELRIRQQEIVDLRSALRAHANKNQELNSAVELSRRRASDLHAAMESERQRVLELESSTSWRFTAPMRWVTDRMRRTVKRLSRAQRPIGRGDRISRLYDAFDPGLEERTRERIKAHIRSNPSLARVPVSILMPTYNRSETIGNAIQSVLDQTHESWELIVVDDGSTDQTAARIAEFASDSRIRYIQRPRGGVGAARNSALESASGEIIAYLDSDNSWDPEFLELMVAGLHMEGNGIGYCATRLVENGEVVGFRGDRFDYDECLAANYIDINSFCHRRSVSESLGVQFDPAIRRTNDWDFILAITYHQDVSYFSFVGVDYTQSSRGDQISMSEPYVFRHLVAERHRRRVEGAAAELEPFTDIVDNAPFTFAIRTAGPRQVRDLWGDHHFALGLAQALERLGHAAKVYYLGEQVMDRFDVVIVLRGLAKYDPEPDAINILWNISHPDQVGFAEFESFDIPLVASTSFQRMLSVVGHKKVMTLLQATDRARFFPHIDVTRDQNLLFVGNSRNVDRPSVRHSINAGLPLSIHGSGWDGRVPDGYIRSPYLPNEEASRAYAGAAALLNDHWESMKDFGIISNRIFDALASGATVITDGFPELDREFGDKVHIFSDEEQFVEIARRVLDEVEPRRSDVRTALEIIERHSFDNRGEQIVEAVRSYLGSPSKPQPHRDAMRLGSNRPQGDSRSLKFAVVPQSPLPGRMTSSAYVRLIQPLTSDLAGHEVALTVIDPNSLDQIDHDQITVVSRTALTDSRQAETLIERTGGGSRLVLDIDDGFHLMDRSHPEYETYEELLSPFYAVMDAAAQVWCSTDALRDSLPAEYSDKANVISNSIDPRLWRRYRNRDRSAPQQAPLGILYMGTATHGPDLELLIPVLEALSDTYPNAFQLSVIGVAPELPKADWIHRVSPDVSSAYPFFARWLRDNANAFDVGVAPLLDTRFNRLKSDIKVLEYTALGLPVIASAVGPYREREGIIRSAEADDWFKALSTLIEDTHALNDLRSQVEHAEIEMWKNRRSAIAGESMVALAKSL